jgi:flagellar protein FlbD
LIRLTRLNGQMLVLNSDLIKFVENTPDTVITLLNGDKLVVRETTDQVVNEVLAFRRAVLEGLPPVWPTSPQASQPKVAEPSRRQELNRG